MVSSGLTHVPPVLARSVRVSSAGSDMPTADDSFAISIPAVRRPSRGRGIPMAASIPVEMGCVRCTLERAPHYARPSPAVPARFYVKILEGGYLDASNPMPKIPSGQLGSSPATSGIFISYRRSDEAGFAGRLYDRLVFTFGRETVFIDVDSIEVGVDFHSVIETSVQKCTVMLVIIGRNRLSAVDARGETRLNDPHDLVRFELEAALARDIRVIPVLVNGASMPKSAELPETISSLARRNGREISHARFDSDSRDRRGSLLKKQPAPHHRPLKSNITKTIPTGMTLTLSHFIWH
jgi:hypothetical protein